MRVKNEDVDGPVAKPIAMDHSAWRSAHDFIVFVDGIEDFFRHLERRNDGGLRTNLARREHLGQLYELAERDFLSPDEGIKTQLAESQIDKGRRPVEL